MALDYKKSRLGRALAWLVAVVVGRGLALMFSTCRVRQLHQEYWDTYYTPGQSGILLTWHRAAIFFLAHFGGYHPAVMISRSNDGELLARFLRVMGGVPVRGSSSGGGMAGLREMARFLEGGPRRYAATVADGPRGPRYVAKDGLIRLSSHTGLPLAPLMWSADRAWRLNNTWDKTMIPKPFAKVIIDFGPPRSYLPNLAKDDLEAARLDLQAEMIELKDRLDAMTGYQDPA